MNPTTINTYLMANASNFPVDSLDTIRQKLSLVPDEKFQQLTSIQLKNPIVAFWLAFFLGGLGIGRFYIGDIVLGILKLITGGGFGIWWIIDLFIIIGATRKKNLMTIMQAPL